MLNERAQLEEFEELLVFNLQRWREYEE